MGSDFDSICKIQILGTILAKFTPNIRRKKNPKGTFIFVILGE